MKILKIMNKILLKTIGKSKKKEEKIHIHGVPIEKVWGSIKPQQ